MRAQGVEDPEEAKLLTAFFEAVHNGEEGTALALAHALNSGESCKWWARGGDVFLCCFKCLTLSFYHPTDPDRSPHPNTDEAEDEEESESSEEEEVKPPPPKKSSSKKKAKGASAASAAAKPKKEEKKKDKGKAAAKPKPKPKAPRLSHGEWESAVLRALAAAAGQAGAAASAAAAQGMEATVVHDAVAADVGAAAYKKGQVGGCACVGSQHGSSFWGRRHRDRRCSRLISDPAPPPHIHTPTTINNNRSRARSAGSRRRGSRSRRSRPRRRRRRASPRSASASRCRSGP